MLEVYAGRNQLVEGQCVLRRECEDDEIGLIPIKNPHRGGEVLGARKGESVNLLYGKLMFTQHHSPLDTRACDRRAVAVFVFPILQPLHHFVHRVMNEL